MSALEEKDHPIAQANAPLDAEGQFVRPMVSAGSKASSSWSGGKTSN